MILTVTLNAAVDKTLTVANLQLGHRHRAQQGLVMAGGKGINVARALKRLGEPVIATGLSGGHNGARILDAITDEGILNDFVRIRGESRTSTVVIDPTSPVQTEIYEYGPEVGADELALVVEKLRYLAGAVTTVILAGSLPRKVPTAFYADVVRDLAKRKVRTVVDCDGEPLRKALAAEPSIVSSDQREAEALVGHEFQTDEDFQHGLIEIAGMGAANVLITLKTGCYALLRSTRNRDRLYRAWIPRVESASSVGSGDALLAGFLSALVRERAPEDCLRLALGCGAANAQEVGAGVFDPRAATRFAGGVEVQEIAPRRAKAS
ncbi:MAG TPA: 1-phosphofructokinase family hexose kinase [Gaiellales bacterium]|jgi:1-phosphofructokinase/tagatose 6-phosphate kinase|nr:1-phosphofructokinase family hexose kinase [Gaiellales bacterium]